MSEAKIPSVFKNFFSSKEGLLCTIFITHFWLSSWSVLGYWSGNKLLFQDAFLLLCIMWALHEKKDPSPVFLSLLIDLVSILLDIIVLSIYFPGTASSTEKFSAVMAILNLAFRFYSIYVLYSNWLTRDDNPDSGRALGSVLSSQPPSVILVQQNNRKNGGESVYGYSQTRHVQQGLPAPEVPAIPPSYSEYH